MHFSQWIFISSPHREYRHICRWFVNSSFWFLFMSVFDVRFFPPVFSRFFCFLPCVTFFCFAVMSVVDFSSIRIQFDSHSPHFIPLIYEFCVVFVASIRSITYRNSDSVRFICIYTTSHYMRLYIKLAFFFVCECIIYTQHYLYTIRGFMSCMYLYLNCIQICLYIYIYIHVYIKYKPFVWCGGEL